MPEQRPALHPLLELTRARLLEFLRDPGALFWVFGFPILLAVALGIAFRNRPPEKVRVVFTPEAATHALASALTTDVIEWLVLEPREAAHALHTAKVDLWVVPDPQDETHFTLRYDPLRPEGRTARLAVDAALQRALGRLDVAQLSEETHADAGGRYIDFLVPGLIGMNLMGSSMWGIGYAVVDARKRKLLKRFAATPMVRAHFLASFVLSRLVFLTFEVAALLAFGHFAFGVPIAGSLAGVAVVSLLGALSFAGLALLIAARPRSTEVAAGWMNFVMMPMYLLSGSFFSYERFPEALHPFLRALPLTALNDALRGVVNDGTGVLSQLVPLGIMGAWGVVGFSLALKWFRWL